jgi:competence ComEA-like helix-hairpin-helix protein
MSNTLPYGDSESPSNAWARNSRTSFDRISACGAKVVDLNAAGVDDLSSLPGIGPTLAQRIISFRAEHGPFSDASELAKVPRIGSRIAARVSERVSAFGRLPGSDPALPLSLGTFGCPPPANVTIESSRQELAPANDKVEEPTAKATPASTEVVSRVVSRMERRHRLGLAAVCVLASMTGLFGGYCLSQSTNHAAAAPVARVAQVEAEHQDMRARLDRQAADLSSTTAAVSKVAIRQTAFETETHTAQARVTQEVMDLSERTRRAQAKTDARVYRLGEAMKLIDWATSGGYATKASADLP